MFVYGISSPFISIAWFETRFQFENPQRMIVVASLEGRIFPHHAISQFKYGVSNSDWIFIVLVKAGRFTQLQCEGYGALHPQWCICHRTIGQRRTYLVWDLMEIFTVFTISDETWIYSLSVTIQRASHSNFPSPSPFLDDNRY